VGLETVSYELVAELPEIFPSIGDLFVNPIEHWAGVARPLIDEGIDFCTPVAQIGELGQDQIQLVVYGPAFRDIFTHG